MIWSLYSYAGSNNKTYLAGEFNGESIKYGEFTLEKPKDDFSKNGDSVFFELDSDFNFIDAFNYGHSSTIFGSWPNDIVSDKNGNKYISGNLQETQDHSFKGIIPIYDSRSPKNNLYYAKMNANNDFEWVQTIGSDKFINNYSRIDIDDEGALYITGAVIGNLYINDTIELNSNYEDVYNVFILKYSSSGEVEWIKTISSSGSSLANSIVSTNKGEVIIGGQSSREVYYSDSNYHQAIRTYNGFLGTLNAQQTLSTIEFAKDNFSVFPNPSTGIVHIDNSDLSRIDNEAYVQVFDIQGRIIYSKTVKKNKLNPLNLTSKKKGAYIIKINDGTTTYHSKFILK